MEPLPKLRAALACVTALAVMNAAGVGCDRQDPIQVKQAAKEPPPSSVAVAPPANGMANEGRSPDDPLPGGHPPIDSAAARMAANGAAGGTGTSVGEAANGDKPIAWTLPAGWKELPGGGMRYATLRISDTPPLEASVARLGAPQSLLPNLNRWEGQLKLPPTAEADVPKVVHSLQTTGGEAQEVDLLGPAGEGGASVRILAAVLSHGPDVWFFKVQGPAEAVEARKANFEALVKSVHFTGASESAGPTGGPIPPAAPPPAAPPLAPVPPTVSERPAGGLESYQVPEGWVRDDPRPMRVVSFRTGPAVEPGNNAGNDNANIIVTTFAAGGFGSMLDNLNRWRREAGLPPLDSENHLKSQPVTVAGHQGELYDFAGPKPPEGGGRRVIVATIPVGDRVWFFKLTGPADAVDGQKANFDSFLSSVKFAAE